MALNFPKFTPEQLKRFQDYNRYLKFCLFWEWLARQIHWEKYNYEVPVKKV